MADFTVRSDSVNVEEIMDQIRARIREKRGVDYTEVQLRELATVKLEKLLDPRGMRSDLVEQFRRRQPEVFQPVILPPVPEHVPYSRTPEMLYTFEAETIYETHRGVLRFVRRLLNPILKLLFNPNPLIQALHRQSVFNDNISNYVNRAIDNRMTSLLAREELITERDSARELQRVERREMDALYYEVIHNLVFELTRLGIENKNLKMRVESIASRLEFNERRARALESAVVYKAPVEAEIAREPAPQSPGAQPVFIAPVRETPPSLVATSAAPPSIGSGPPPAGAGQPSTGSGQIGAAIAAEGPGQRSRRRRRRRGRRGGASAVALMGGTSSPAAGSPQNDVTAEPGGTAGPMESPTAQPTEISADAAPAPESTGPGSDTDPQ